MASRGEQISRFLTAVLDCIFPQFCLNCEKEGKVVCASCEKIVLDKASVFWFPCVPEPYKHAALWHYRETNFPGKIIGALKYQLVIEVSSIIQSAIKMFITTNPDFFANIELLVAVPLHRRRLAERGFNQAEIIARIIATQLQIKNVPTALRRVRATQQQAKLDLAVRKKNVYQAFQAEKKIVSGKICLLVDDVYTTGSTIKEAKAALINAGAIAVRTLTLARPLFTEP